MKKFDLQKHFMSLAESCVTPATLKDSDGSDYFCLVTFLEELAMSVEESFDCGDVATGGFELDSVGVARYLWVCLAKSEGISPCGPTFRDLPIAD